MSTKHIQEKHSQLEALKVLWNYPEDVLNKILWVNTSEDHEGKELAVGLASEYIDFMDAVVETDNPAEAWNYWCLINKIEHESSNNPYL